MNNRLTGKRIKAEIGTSGVFEALTLSGDANEDLLVAVRREHRCDDSSCDIAEAASNGFGHVAAFLLDSATECPMIEAVRKAYHIKNRHGVPRGWKEWYRHFRRVAWECEACGSFTFQSELGEEPESCGNCKKEGLKRLYRRSRNRRRV